MPRYEITSPEGKRFEVTAPDGASQDDVLAYAQSQFKAPDRPASPVDDMSGVQRFMAGVGKGAVDIGRGAGQLFGLKSQADIDEARKLDAPLMNTGAGMAGNIAGSIATAVPAMMVPGANSVAGASVLGGLLNALQPTAKDESRLKNTVVGAALGGAGQFALGKGAQMLGNRLVNKEASEVARKSQNAATDAVLSASRDAGYVVPPSLAEAGVGSRVLEGVSGQTKTKQLASVKNQNVTERLAREALGLGPDEALSAEAMQTLRTRAYENGYAPIAELGSVQTGKPYADALDKIVSTRKGASNSFPAAVKDEVTPFVDSMRVPEFDAGDAIKMTRVLRDKASEAYGSGNKELGKAYRETSKVLEDELERHLTGLGKDGADMLKNFREARELMAKSHNVEAALAKGGGQVDARVFAEALRKNKPLTGDLKTIGDFAKQYGEAAAVPKSGWANPITVWDATTGSLGSSLGGPAAWLYPGARVAARYSILSQPYQKAFVAPQYGAGLLDKLPPEVLKRLERMGAGGLLGYSAQ